ncbi:MAG: hypothetical protein RI883_921 [Bacteroidota bacterium]|jgi:uncharacterized membrane protein
MERKSLFIVVTLILLKLVVSIPFLTSQPIDLDEPFSIYHAQKSLPHLFSIFKTENNPPLHFIFLHFWEQLFGIGAISVRSLSLLFSVLTIPVLWLIGKRFINLKAAITLCILFIFSDYHHYHGIEARTYSLLVLEYSILLYYLLKILIDKTDKKVVNYIIVGFLNALLFYTHYIFPFILLSEIIVIIIFYKTIDWKKILLTVVVFIALTLPWISVLLMRVNSINTSGTWVSPAQHSELYGFINKFFNDRWVFMTLIVIVVTFILLKRTEVQALLTKNQKIITLLFVLIIVPFCGAFLLSKYGGIALFLDRYLFFLTIPLFVLSALILSHKGKVFEYLSVVFIIIFIARFDIKIDNNRDGDKLATYVKSTGINTIVIAPEYYDLTFLYHYNRQLFMDDYLRLNEIKNGFYPLINEQTLERISSKNEVVLIDADYSFSHPTDTTLKWFDTHFIKKSQRKFKGNYTVSVFQKKN